MLGRENRQAGGHRFEHGIRHAFLIPVGAGLARMQKDVRLIIELAQFRLRNEAGESYALGDLQFIR